MKSDIIRKKVETLPHRALLMSAGVSYEDIKSEGPFIGIANSYTNLVPGHVHLDELVEEVARGVRDAGGVPFVWGVPAVCDGIAMHVEMRLSLPSRDNIADNVEIMALSHSLDGWVGVTNCDKVTPGMLMAAGRLDLPAIMLTGGPMAANNMDGCKHHPIEGFSLVGKVKSGDLGRDAAEARLQELTCGPGSCVGLFTANTMAIVTEVLGMSLSGCATTPAVSPLKRRQAYQTGRKIIELVGEGLRPGEIMTANAFRNAITVDMAVGGSTNAVLHIPAIAKSVGVDIAVENFDRVARQTPNICALIPSGQHEMVDLDRAGGVPALLSRLEALLEDSVTVGGSTTLEIARSAKVLDDEVVRPLDRPFHPEGGIAILKGNIAASSVIKQTAVSEMMMAHSGPARVCNSEEDLLAAIEAGELREGDVVVLPYQGMAGGPGMPEMLTPTDAIKGAGFERVALLTDGRFSGGTSGPCIGHIEPEAYLGGPIAAVRDGDTIDIDIPNRSLNVRLSDEEIAQRCAEVCPPEREITPLLERYREEVEKRA